MLPNSLKLGGKIYNFVIRFDDIQLLRR